MISNKSAKIKRIFGAHIFSNEKMKNNRTRKTKAEDIRKEREREKEILREKNHENRHKTNSNHIPRQRYNSKCKERCRKWNSMKPCSATMHKNYFVFRLLPNLYESLCILKLYLKTFFYPTIEKTAQFQFNFIWQICVSVMQLPVNRQTQWNQKAICFQ